MPNHCFFCGLSVQDFVSTGKFGCSYCLGAFLRERRIGDKILAKMEWGKRKSGDAREKAIGSWDRFRPSFVGKGCREWSDDRREVEESGVSGVVNFTARYRVARNLRTGFFLPRDSDLSEAIDLLLRVFPGLEETPSQPGDDSTGSGDLTRIRFYHYPGAWEKGDCSVRFRLGDEDKIRWEIRWKGRVASPHPLGIPDFPQKKQVFAFLRDKSLFSYDKDWGFLNSCPTNCGRGDRFSVVFHQGEISTPPEQGKTNWSYEANGCLGTELEIADNVPIWYFSGKNFHRRRKMYFLQSVVPSGFKGSGSGNPSKPSSNM